MSNYEIENTLEQVTLDAEAEIERLELEEEEREEEAAEEQAYVFVEAYNNTLEASGRERLNSSDELELLSAQMAVEMEALQIQRDAA